MAGSSGGGSAAATALPSAGAAPSSQATALLGEVSANFNPDLRHYNVYLLLVSGFPCRILSRGERLARRHPCGRQCDSKSRSRRRGRVDVARRYILHSLQPSVDLLFSGNQVALAFKLVYLRD